ncbi:hypothetical protein EF847_18485 [Actinobacteria bacterium YIM 96077]|uniref:SnoaL-like domain-containing protein n=1 Tax=Phytoactinopolyspora halophila TaxID=1981511 RepID=A0A329QHP1_9ACTN|nr:nuclear transport factor 2 family protein [Phytoactinopolyspora halophila]AYY14385.1 hypothetical protein EF847_18485 [Actinobacteria bacterium YIM 96077]RAW11893.1 hypothetical protein DPM12_15635 [Phytoactinopolyspora halophila]
MSTTGADAPARELVDRWTVAELQGDVAVINGVLNQEAAYQGKPFSGRFRLTLVAVDDESDHKIVNIQLSSMADQ